MAENACDNGVEFLFNTEVKVIEKTEKGYGLKTGEGTIHAAYVINAAGVYADVFHNMVSEEKIHITVRKGDYCLLDKEAGTHVSHTIFQLPGKMGKGVLVTPTVHGNLLIGPSATDVEDKEGVNTDAADLSDIMVKAAWGVKNIPFRQTITSFSGLRAHEPGMTSSWARFPMPPASLMRQALNHRGLQALLPSAFTLPIWLQKRQRLPERRILRQPGRESWILRSCLLKNGQSLLRRTPGTAPLSAAAKGSVRERL